MDAAEHLKRSARFLVAPPMEVRCTCGWSAIGPARNVEKANYFHACQKRGTD